jgi:hypothetical protein
MPTATNAEKPLGHSGCPLALEVVDEGIAFLQFEPETSSANASN